MTPTPAYTKNNIPKIEKVAVVKCSNYEQAKVDKAVRKALKLIKFNPINRTKVLIKPNVVVGGRKPEQQIAISTHPSLIEAVCKFLKENECTIYIGESSFMSTDCFLKQAGITDVAKRYAKNGKPTIFEQEKLIEIHDKKAKILKKFEIAKILKEADYILDMPKIKTHTLTEYTGGIKNLYGVIPGGLKQSLHNLAKGEKNFSQLLVDIYQNIKPQLTIMDAVIGMEGHGPTSGTPKKAGLILASKNAVALDIAACRIMGINPKKIFHINYAVQRKLYPNSYNFQLVGDFKKLPVIHFRMPRLKARKGMTKRVFREPAIICDHEKCIKCGICAGKCPAKAIKLIPWPTINTKKCIRCFCCMEVCPTHALRLEEKI